MGTVFSSSEDEGDEEELEQEPEMPLFDNSSSPLSPQISMSRSPFFGPSIRNAEPYSAISPVSLSPTSGPVTHLSRFYNDSVTIHPGPFLPSWLLAAEEFNVEVYLIRHAQSTDNLRPEYVIGRSPSAILTETGKFEAHALGVFLRSTGVMFDAVYSSPAERAKQTAEYVCQALSIPEDQVELADALQEMSQGQWEGRRHSDVYTKDVVLLLNNMQPDFRAPGGESQRQVEFRTVEFLNNIILPRATISLQEDAKLGNGKRTVHTDLAMQVHPFDELEMTLDNDVNLPEPVKVASGDTAESELERDCNGDDLIQVQDGLTDGISEEERLPDMMTMRGTENFQKKRNYCVAVFSHAMAIKCALKGLLGSDPHRIQQICIDNTSMTVLKHCCSTGWQVKRMNDTAHLRLL